MRILTTHIYADFDAFASVVAAGFLFPDSKLIIPKPKSRNVEEFLKEHPEYAPVELSLETIRAEDIHGVIIIDTSDVSRVGELSSFIEEFQPNLTLIDHHPNPPSPCPYLKEDIRASFGACSSLIVHLLKQKGLSIPQNVANLLLLGIYEDTGGLMNASTVREDFEACAWLAAQGARVGFVRGVLARSLTLSELEILHRLKSAARFVPLNGNRLLLSHAETAGHEGELSHLVQEILDIGQAEAAIVIFECEGRMLVVGRSMDENIRLDRLFAELGGGGHKTAASVSLPAQSLVELRERIESLIHAHLVRTVRAEEFMSAPPIGILADRPIEEAILAMNRYAINSLVVWGANGELVGLFSRMIAERALYHGLHGARVSDFMLTDFEKIQPDTPIEEVGELLLRTGQRLLPVVKNSHLLGVVTRKDYLKEMLRKHKEKPQGLQLQGSGKKSKPQLAKRLPEVLKNLFKDIGLLSEELGMPAYAVGGFVRDLFLGIPTLDVDIVVVGDGLGFARELASRLGSKMRVHKAFGTASVFIRSDIKLDIATARIESYDYPGAWPKVAQSTLKQDLARRDFTVNTLALDLRPDRFLELVDFYGGLVDLKHRLLRVLHNLSFVEDPTRAFRAYRFAVRLEFKLSKETQRLIKKAIELGLIGKLEGPRILKELGLIALEGKAVEIVERLGAEGLLRAVMPELDLTVDKRHILQGLGEVLVWHAYSFPGSTLNTLGLILAILLWGEGPSARALAFQRLKAPLALSKFIEEALESSKDILSRLEEADESATEIDRILKGSSIEVLLLVMALAKSKKVRESVSRYLLVFSKISPELRGRDLLALGFSPSPLIGEILEALRQERLSERLSSKEDEVRWVLEHFGNRLPSRTSEWVC